MEPTATQAPAATPAPTQNSGNSALSANSIIVILFNSMVAGFAIGLGFILAQKVTKRNVSVDQKSDSNSMAANGNPSVMYPPRMRPPMGMPARPPYGYGYGMPYGQGYNQANGSEQTFNIDSWLHGNSSNNIKTANLVNVPD